MQYFLCDTISDTLFDLGRHEDSLVINSTLVQSILFDSVLKVGTAKALMILDQDDKIGPDYHGAGRW